MAIGQWAPPAADENTIPWLLANPPPQKKTQQGCTTGMDTVVTAGIWVWVWIESFLPCSPAAVWSDLAALVASSNL